MVREVRQPDLDFEFRAAETTGPMPQIGTLNGNPVASAAGLATLKVLREKGIYERTIARGKRLKEGLEKTLREAEIPATITGHETVFDVYFMEGPISNYRDTLKGDKQKQGKFTALLRDKGVFKGDTKYYISTAHSDADVDQTIEAFDSDRSSENRRYRMAGLGAGLPS